MHLLLPLIAAISFALGSLVYKRAFAEGATVAHGVVINNLVVGILFAPLIFLESHPVPWNHWYYPVLTALSFVMGHLLHVVSIRVGDVSVATPLLGSKVIFVAFLGWIFFGTELNAAQWTAAALATAGVVIMGLTDLTTSERHSRMGITTFAATGCAASFALTDMLIQTWGGPFGVWSFLSIQFVALGVFSAASLPFLGGPTALRAPQRAWKWIIAGSLLSATQGIIITATIAVWKDAAGVNIVYATRGLWSIVLVWCVGHWLQNTERQNAGPRRMAYRLAGTILILIAVILTVRFG